MGSLSSILSTGFAIAFGWQASPHDLQHPPAIIATQVNALLAGGLDREQTERLTANPALFPYLRQALTKKLSLSKFPGQKTVRLALANRILERSTGWVAEGRVDLLMEAGVGAAPLDELTTAKLVNRMYELLRPRVGSLHPLPTDQLELFQKFAPLTPLKEKAVWGGRYARGDTIDLPTKDVFAHFSRVAVAKGHDVSGLVYASNGILNKWGSSNFIWLGVTVSGGDVNVSGLRNALVIVDGDIVLPETDYHNNALVIATGSITGKAWNTSFQSCHLYAGGDIRVTGTIASKGSILRAGGKVICTNPQPEKFLNHVNGYDFKLTGLKFFKTEDVGLVLGGQAKAMTVKELADTSPLRKGLRVGDVLSEINGRAIIHKDDARRAIREATVLEYAEVKLKRDGKSLTKLIMLPATISKK